MNIKKPLLVLGAVTGIGLAGIAGLGVASATTSTNNGADSIIEKIATKFNVNKEDVAAVFDEERNAREAEHQQKMTDRLTQAVEDGKITEEQKSKILAKQQELQAKREEWKDKTPEERREAKKELHDTLKQWAEDNDVPLRYLMFVGGHHGHGHGHGPMGDKASDSSDDS